MGNPILFPVEQDRLNAIIDAHQSFFSGHSAFACQAAVFLVTYVHRQAKGLTGNVIVLPFFNILVGITTFIVCANHYM